MLAFVDSPGSIPAPVSRRLTPTDFKDLAYSPSLQLSAHFDASLTADPEYQESCEWGFDSYFAEMHCWLPDLRGYTFLDHLHTPVEVEQYLLREAIYDPVYNPGRLASRAGWSLGWLSALALTDASLALSGLELFQELVLDDEGKYDEDDYDEDDRQDDGFCLYPDANIQ